MFEKTGISRFFYVQEELYGAASRMKESGDARDGLYGAASWMKESSDALSAFFLQANANYQLPVGNKPLTRMLKHFECAKYTGYFRFKAALAWLYREIKYPPFLIRVYKTGI